MSSTDIAQRSPLQELVNRVGGDQFKQQVALALPEGVRPERFARIAITALQQNADLAKCTPDSVFRSLLKCAADGLLPDGREAAIVKRGDTAVYQSMISGLRKIAAEYGWTLRTFAVHEHDLFSQADVLSMPTHTPPRPGVDRGPVVAAWAVATHRDGRREFRVMQADEIAKRRALATTQNVWNKWEAEMAEKTVGRDLFAELSFAEADRDRIRSVLAAAADTDPAEARTLIYGNTETPAQLPAGTGTNPSDVATSPPAQAERTTDAGATQASAAATSLPAAAEDPGHDDEPSLEDDAGGVDQDVADAARLASQFHPPTGQYKDLSLAEILAVGEKGEGWLRWALGKGDSLTPDAYRQAVWSFSRIYAPSLFQAALAKQEASA